MFPWTTQMSSCQLHGPLYYGKNKLQQWLTNHLLNHITEDDETILISGTTVILKGQALSDIVSGSKEKPKTGAEALAAWEKEDVKAQTILVTRIEEGTLVNLLSCETSHEMWAKL
ncbi:hypothetical protein HUJ04_005288, partial [Dendroctonus ponderosae]